jgi:hypothetical protein
VQQLHEIESLTMILSPTAFPTMCDVQQENANSSNALKNNHRTDKASLAPSTRPGKRVCCDRQQNLNILTI